MMNTINTHHETARRSIVLLTMALLALFTFSYRASAQGTLGTFPDPITSSELDLYAKRLNLSNEQYRTLLNAHDQYKEDFRALREGRIAELMEETRGLNMAGSVPDRDVVKKLIDKVNKLNGQIASLDNQLFQAVFPMLTESQQSLLPRIRQHRERKRLAGNNMMSIPFGGRFVDLSELVLELDPAREHLEPIDPLLAQYERRLTSAMQEVHQGSSEMMLEMIDALEDAGLADLDFSDPETMREHMEQIQAIWQELFADLRAKGREMTELNDQTCAELVRVLGGETGRRLRDHYIAEAYPQAAFALDTGGTQFDAALELEEIDDQQREAIESAAAGYRQAMDQLLDKTLETIREARANRSMMDPGGAWREQREKLNELKEKAERRTKQADETLASILNDQQQSRYAALARKRLQKRMNEGLGGLGTDLVRRMGELAEQEAGAPEEEASASEQSAQATSSNVVSQVGMDQYLPTGISHADVRAYSRELDLDEGEQAVLRELHASYIDRLDRIKDNQVADVLEHGQAITSLWGGDAQSAPDIGEADVEKIGAARRAALKAIERAEQAFFDDVDLILSSEAQRATLKQLRDHRARQRLYNVGGHMWGGNERTWRVDVVRLIEQHDFDPQQQKKVDAIVGQYADQLIERLEKRYEATLDVDAAQQKWMIERWKARRNNNDDEANTSIFDSSGYQDVMQWQQKAREASQAVTALNETILREVRSALDEEVGAALQRAYDKKAFPDVYEEQFGVSKTLQKALELNTLTEAQRTELQNLAGQYHQTFDEQAEQLLELHRQAPQRSMGMDRENWQRFAEHRQNMSKIQFERRELASRTITEIKIILEEDQIKSIGGLPEVSENQGGFRMYR